MPQYPPIVDLSTLNGANGFRLDGIDLGDWSGFSVASAGDVNGDGFDDLIIGAPSADPGDDNVAGEAYVVFGAAGGWGAAFDLAALNGTNGFRLEGVDAEDQAGYSVAGAGDVNGDGLDDLIIGAIGGDGYAGETYVVFGAAGGWGATFDLASLNGANGFRLDGIDAGDWSGYSVAGAGDVNGDGFDDVIVGAMRADAGETYVVFGAASGWSASLDLATLDGMIGFRLDGIDPGDFAGISVAGAGDVNGDGFDDLIIGAHVADAGGDSNAGETYVVFGASAGWGAVVDLATLNGTNGFRLDGIDVDDLSGYSAASAGDVNGDGLLDLIIGAIGGNFAAGEAYVVFGAAGGWGATFDLASLNGTNGFRLGGVDYDDWLGLSVASAGDFNGDGFDDLILSAGNADPNGESNAGETYVVFGASAGWGAVVDLATLNGTNGFRLDGIDPNDYSGHSVASAGDINGDGFDDLIIGANRASAGGSANGETYVVFGGGPAEAVTRTGTNISNTIHGGAFNDTLNGLGGTDILNGGAGHDRLDGGADNDAINGGAGVDTAIFALTSTGATWVRDISGAWTVNAGVVQGVDTLTDVEVLEFADRNVALDNAQQTFSGNGTSDFLWRNSNHGTVVVWEMTGTTQNSAAVAGGAPANWSIVGVGDIDGDGKDDLLWQNNVDGGVAGWLMDGATPTAIAMVGGAPSEWQIAGIGDFNFDGKDDIVWRNTSSGAVAIWRMDGLSSHSDAIISGAPLEWDIAAIADFDGDGSDDILLRNNDSVLARWTTDGAVQTGAAIIGVVPSEWQIAGTGDFDGDGRADIIWRDSNTGAANIWRMDGDTTLDQSMIGVAPAEWSIAQIGDFSGDGKDDIIWRNDDGTLALWVMNGFSVTSETIIGIVPTEWGLI